MEITIEMYNEMVKRNAMLEFEIKQTRDAQYLTRAECDRLERHNQMILRNNNCLKVELEKTNTHLTMTRNDNNSLRKNIGELHKENEVLKKSCAAPSEEQESIINSLKKDVTLLMRQKEELLAYSLRLEKDITRQDKRIQRIREVLG